MHIKCQGANGQFSNFSILAKTILSHFEHIAQTRQNPFLSSLDSFRNNPIMFVEAVFLAGTASHAKQAIFQLHVMALTPFPSASNILDETRFEPTVFQYPLDRTNALKNNYFLELKTSNWDMK
jgi:hypothetical protein